jgi:hypothetical protein
MRTLNTDLWGLVLRFALDLELLDAVCLRDARNFALVDRQATAAVQLLTKPPQLRLRARVHRLLGFKKAPPKTELRQLFPHFFKTLPDHVKVFPLAEVSTRIAGAERGEAWVAWAEARPRRLAVRKRNREDKAEQHAKKQALVKQELQERGLPFSAFSPEVLSFCQGRTQSIELVLQQLADNQLVECFVAARDKQAPYDLVELQKLAKQHAVVVREPLPLFSTAHLLARLWLRQRGVFPDATEEIERLEGEMLVRAGRALMAAPDTAGEAEAAVWLQAARDTINSALRL